MLSMGIIGMGKMAASHAEWIIAHKDLNLVAVCDLNKERVEQAKAKYGVEGFTDVNKLLAKEGLDYVVIVTTNTVHEELAVNALEKKINVIVEKPMSLNYDSAMRMVQAAEKNKRNLFVHQSSRWDRDFQLVKETIASGQIGDLLQIQSRVFLCDEGWPSWGIDGMSNPWRIKAQYGGGMLLDWGPHLVDQMLVLMGKEPTAVFGVLQSGVWSKEVDDYFNAILRFEGDVVFQIEVSNNGRIPAARWHIIGSKGTLEVKGRHEPVWEDAEIVFDRPNGKTERHNIHLVDVCESGLEGGFYQDLVLYHEGKKQSFVSMYEAAKVMKVLDLIRRSNNERQVLPYNSH